MLLGNYSLANKNPGREFGQDIAGKFWKASTFQTKFLTEDRATDYSPYSGLPYGYSNGASFVLPQKAGAIASRMTATGTVSSAQGQNGYPLTSDLTGTGTISNAAGGLIVEMVAALVGSGTLSASVIGQLEAVATLAGSGSITAAASALAGMVADLVGSSTITAADETGLGEMVANIYVNESQATVDQIVTGVWEAIAAEHNNPGTMGEAMNGAGSAGNPWITDLSGYTTPNSAGKILKDAASDAAAAAYDMYK